MAALSAGTAGGIWGGMEVTHMLTFGRAMSWVVLCGCLLAVEAAAASLELHAPAVADTGAAFLAQVRTDAAGDTVVFHWRGKAYAVPLEADTPTAVAPAGGLTASPAGRTAYVLLPVPLDEKKMSLPLTVQLGTGANAVHTARTIQVRRTQRPEQRLTVEPKYVAPPPQERERIQQERELVLAALAGYSTERLWTLPLLRPVAGAPSSLFGLKRIFNGEPRGEHKGLDLRGAAGTPIRALADGRVVLARSLYYSGNAVYVDHGLGVFSAYMHMSAFAVRAGQTVRRGDVLGQVGATGRVTGPHLHLSLYVQGSAVDPEPLLEARQEKNHAQK